MKKLLYLCLFPFLGISCMDDLGTYDYNPLHEITIDTLKNRTIEIYHQLEVEPKISFSIRKTFCSDSIDFAFIALNIPGYIRIQGMILYLLEVTEHDVAVIEKFFS